MEFILHLYISHFPTIVSCKPSSRKDNKSFLWEPALLQLSFRSEQALGTVGEIHFVCFCLFSFELESHVAQAGPKHIVEE